MHLEKDASGETVHDEDGNPIGCDSDGESSCSCECAECEEAREHIANRERQQDYDDGMVDYAYDTWKDSQDDDDY